MLLEALFVRDFHIEIGLRRNKGLDKAEAGETWKQDGIEIR